MIISYTNSITCAYHFNTNLLSFSGVKRALESRRHNGNGCPLTVTEMKNVNISENEVLVRGLSPTTSRECLMLYMEEISNYMVVNSIKYVASLEESVHNAIVKFYTTIGELRCDKRGF